MGLNLNNAGDFAKLTMSAAGSALFQLAGLGGNNWSIQESSYGHPPSPLILFHIFKSNEPYNAAVSHVQDTAGRRKVPFKFPYVDGQTTDDLGREGETWDFDIVIFGAGYLAQYQALIAEFNNPVPGTLVHPVRGRMKVAVNSWEVTHSNETRQALAMRVKFIEHNFDVSFVPLANVQNNFKSALSSALSFFNQISAVVNTITANTLVLKSFTTLLGTSITSFQSLFGSNLTQLNNTFNGGSSTDLPTLLPVNPGTNSGSTFPVAVSPSDPFSAIPPTVASAQLLTALAVQQAVAQQIALRQSLNTILQTFASINQGELIFYNEILTLKQSAISIQQVLQVGIQSSSASITNYVTPRLMTIREVAFANGISLDNVIDLQTLNPTLLSYNFIPQGTSLQVTSG